MRLQVAPQFAVVSPYYKSSLVIVNGAASIAAKIGWSEGLSPLGYDRYFKSEHQSKRSPYALDTIPQF